MCYQSLKRDSHETVVHSVKTRHKTTRGEDTFITRRLAAVSITQHLLTRLAQSPYHIGHPASTLHSLQPPPIVSHDTSLSLSVTTVVL